MALGMTQATALNLPRSESFARAHCHYDHWRMKVVVPYKTRQPLVENTLKQYGYTPEMRQMAHDHSYWFLLDEIWRDREDVIIVEHDILPWPGALEELAACPKPWCSFSYHRPMEQGKNGIGDHFGFGCVKFSRELMEAVPNAFVDMADHHWSQLDSQFEWYTLQHGLRPHHHRPGVVHIR